MLAKYPERIWAESRHWISLEGEWVPVSKLVYSYSMQSLIQTKHLFPAIRGKVADYTKLTADLCAAAPFNALSPLSAAIEERIERGLILNGTLHELPWLRTFAGLLARVLLPNMEETAKVRELARRLGRARCVTLPQVHAVPYLDGTPAGPARELPAAWSEDDIVIRKASQAAMAKAVSDALGHAFALPEIQSALQFCSDRPNSFIVEYMQDNFELADEELLDGPTDHNESTSGPAVPQVVPVDVMPGTLVQAVESIGKSGEETHDVSEGSPAENDEEDEPRAPRTSPSRPRKAPLIERYALSKGFAAHSSGGFHHPSGLAIEPDSGGIFEWRLRNASGDHLRGILPIECCLLAEPLELSHEVWAYSKKYPESSLLLLTDGSGEPWELAGEDLHRFAEEQLLILHPATYRIRCARPEEILRRLTNRKPTP
jgi:hypothetical protein